MQILEDEDDNCGANKVPSFQRNGSLICPIPFLLIDSLSRKSFSYCKLPQEPLRITIRKLDGTSFEIEVAKNGTVAELKEAVEAAFGHLPKKGPGKVSWSHVWGHFCLCYGAQKLLNDSDYIGSFGIKDGDQLQFIRHVSINYNMIRTHSEREEHSLDKPRISGGCKDREQNDPKDQCVDVNIESCKAGDNGRDDDNVHDADEEHEDNGSIMSCEYKLAHLFRGWFSYRKLANSDMGIEQRSGSSKISNSCFGSFKNLLRLYTNKYDSPERESWKAE